MGRRGAWAALLVLLAGGPAGGGGQGVDGGIPATATAPAGAVRADLEALRAPLPVDEARVAEMLERAGPGARRLESEHFVVVHTAPPARARELTWRLEAVYRAHVRLVDKLGLPARAAEHKLAAYYLASQEEFARHVAAAGRPGDGPGAETLGYYDWSGDCVLLFDLETHASVAAVRAAIEEAPAEERPRLVRRMVRRLEWLGRSVVQHEAAHQVQRHLGLVPVRQRAPAWLVEGLAMQFEVPLAPDGTVREPFNGYRLYEFRKLYGARPALDGAASWLVDEGAWCGGECYPAAWAVVWYLGERQPDALAGLLRRAGVADGWPVEPAARRRVLEEALGEAGGRWLDGLHAAVMALPLAESGFAE